MAKPGKHQSSVHRHGAGPASPLLLQAVGLQRQGRLDEAEALYRKLLKGRANDPDALHYLGLIAFQRGQFADAAERIERAIRFRGDVPAYYCNLGNAYARLKQREQAVVAYRKAVALDPGFAVGFFSLGAALNASGKSEEAVPALRRAIELQPGLAEAWQVLGEALLELERIDEADDCFQRVLALRPDHVNALLSRAGTLMRFAQADAALECSRRATALAPENASHGQKYLFALNYANLDPAEVFAAHRDWARRHADPLTPAEAPKVPPHARLRVGYLSQDFRRHVMQFFVEPVLRCHDRERFEIFCYHDSTITDEVTLRLKQYPDHWLDCKAMDDDALRARIRQDEIDILVDLAGHSGNNRMLTLACKPAPVLVTMHGYLNTTGMKAMDYRVSDAIACPPACEALHVEKILRMPHCQWCYQPPADAPAPGDPPAIERGQVTFGCFHNLAKINPRVVALWADLLKAVPNARLMLVAWGAKAVAHLRAAFAERGVDEGRLVFREPARHEEYLKMYREVDIGLDVFPYAGGTTSCESLWMGVPYVSLLTDSVPGRGGASVLSAAGLPELIADSADRYVDIGRALAADLPRLAALRAQLRRRVANSPLTDAAGYTAALEAHFQRIAASPRTASAPIANA